MATIIDPPSGWKYGFPRPIPEDRIEDVLVWLVEQGYPQSEIDSLGEIFTDCCRYWEQEEQPKQETSKVTRVEVIQHSPPYNGRAYTNYDAKDVEIQFQDDGRTLKIFLK